MKKMIAALLLLAVICSLPVTAYAEDATTGDMTVSYEYTAPSGGGSGGSGDSGGDTPTYTIGIPAFVTQDNIDLIPITVSQNNIAEGKEVVVTVDWDSSYDTSGYFNLYKNKDEANQEEMRCRVMMYTDSTLTMAKYVDVMQESRDIPIARFISGSTLPTFGGYLSLDPLTDNLDVSSGTYTGILYFNIRVTDVE